MWSPGWRSLHLNGPVPTGAVLSGVLFGSGVSAMCFGTMKVQDRIDMYGAYGCAIFQVISVGLTTVTSRMNWWPVRRPARNLVLLLISRLNFTSAAVNGVPSCHLTPSR